MRYSQQTKVHGKARREGDDQTKARARGHKHPTSRGIGRGIRTGKNRPILPS